MNTPTEMVSAIKLLQTGFAEYRDRNDQAVRELEERVGVQDRTIEKLTGRAVRPPCPVPPMPKILRDLLQEA